VPSYYYGDYDPLAGITQEQHDLILAIGTGTGDITPVFSPTPVQPGTTWNPTSVGTVTTTAGQAAGTEAMPSTSTPTWVFAVNLPSTYPDFAAMKAAGAGLVIVSDDPNAAALVAAAQQWGVAYAIQVNAPPGITPEEYAARVAASRAQYGATNLVLDIESVGKGYAGSAGWEWSQRAAALLKDVTAGTTVAVTMEPNQDDYNYAAYQGLGTGTTQYWVQSYLGDMTGLDPEAVRARLIANGVSADQITVILGPNQQATGDYNWASYGLPTNNPVSGIYGGYPTTGGGETGTQGPAPYDPGSPVPPGSGGGSGSGTTYPVPVPPYDPDTGTFDSGTDWAAAYFGSLGLPADIVKKVNDIFKKYPDTNQAIQFALAYIRGTSWYAQTFPGIQYGIQHGLIADERDYLQYVTAMDSLAQRYWGRNISSEEIASFLFSGKTPDIVGREYAGLANIMAYSGEYNYYLGAFGEGGRPSDAEMKALGEEQAGLDSPLGQKLKRSLDAALQRYSKLFEGTAGTPSLSLGSTGLSAPSLAGGKTKPDVSA
jgi:hypothetical protein